MSAPLVSSLAVQGGWITESLHVPTLSFAFQASLITDMLKIRCGQRPLQLEGDQAPRAGALQTPPLTLSLSWINPSSQLRHEVDGECQTLASDSDGDLVIPQRRATGVGGKVASASRKVFAASHRSSDDSARSKKHCNKEEMSEACRVERSTDSQIEGYSHWQVRFH